MRAPGLQRLGVPGLLGVALLCAAAWVQWVWVPQQQTQADELTSKARQRRHELLDRTQAAGAPAVRELTADEAWQTLSQALPTSNERTPLQAEVLASARTLGLTLAAVQFKGAPEGATGLWRQRLTLPVQGRYADVRAWIGQLLLQPALSIDALDIQRTDVMSDAVKARVSLSLWWRTDEEGRH